MSGRIACDESAGTLTISGVDLSDPVGRWCCYDLMPLLTDIAQRGTDLLIPGAAGRRPKRRRLDVTRYLLPMIFTGWVDDLGDDVDRDQAVAQLQSTLVEFTGDVVGTPTPPGDGTRPAVFTLANGDQWTTDLHVLMLRRRETAWGIWDGDLEISLPLEWETGS